MEQAAQQMERGASSEVMTTPRLTEQSPSTGNTGAAEVNSEGTNSRKFFADREQAKGSPTKAKNQKQARRALGKNSELPGVSGGGPAIHTGKADNHLGQSRKGGKTLNESQSREKREKEGGIGANSSSEVDSDPEDLDNAMQLVQNPKFSKNPVLRQMVMVFKGVTANIKKIEKIQAAQSQELAEAKKEMQQQKQQNAEEIRSLQVELTADRAVFASQFELVLGKLHHIAVAIDGANGYRGGAAGGAMSRTTGGAAGGAPDGAMGEAGSGAAGGAMGGITGGGAGGTMGGAMNGAASNSLAGQR